MRIPTLFEWGGGWWEVVGVRCVRMGLVGTERGVRGGGKIRSNRMSTLCIISYKPTWNGLV